MAGTSRRRSWRSRLKELLWSGEAVDRQGFWREREAAFRAELSLNPSLKHIWVQYGHALKEQGQLDAAEQAYRRSLALDAALADTNLQLGHVLKLQGRTADAADAYLTAHRFDPDLPDPHIELRQLGLEMPPVIVDNSEFSVDPEFIQAAYGISPEPADALVKGPAACRGAGADGRYVSAEHALRAHALTARVWGVFDFRYYFYANPAVQNAIGILNRHRCLLHFCTHGITDVLQCNRDKWFDAIFYCDAYLPWRLSASNAYWHWLNVGAEKGWYSSRDNWLKNILGSDLAARASIDFEPCRTFFYGNEGDVKWTRLFDRFLDAEVLCDGPHLPVTPETADFFAAIANRFGFSGLNDDAAISLYERVLLSVPHHRQALLNYADCLQRKRLFLQAAAIHGGLMDSNQSSVWSFLHHATCYTELGDFRRALTSLHLGIARFPGAYRLQESFDSVADRLLKHEWETAFAIGKVGRYGEAQSRMEGACEFVSSKMTVTERVPHKAIRSVAIVGSLYLPQCYFYRIEQKVEHLGAAGYNVVVYDFYNQVDEFIRDIYKYEAVIFYRVPATAPILRAISKSKELGLVTFYEIDDLIFVGDDYPGTFESCRGEITLDVYIEFKLLLPMYRHAMSLCDYGIASTSALAIEMTKIVPSWRVSIHRNAFGRKHERLSMGPPVTRDSERVTIFYGSGTRWHKEDFRDLLEPALVEIVARHGKRVHIVLAGHIVMSEALESIRQNTTLINPIIWDIDEYWSILRRCDINLAVLKKTPFADCKSEIKWMEAAMFGIPSVVSGTATYEDVIEPGVTGFICSTIEEWVAVLDLLVRDASLRRRVGDAARHRVHEAYNFAGMSKNLESIFAQTVPVPKSPPKPTIVIVNTFYPPQAIGEAARIVHDNVKYLVETYKDDFQVEVFTTGWWTAQDYEIRRYVSDRVRVTAVCRPGLPAITEADADRRMGELFGEYLDRIDPALIHFHVIERLTASVVSAALARSIPYLITAHDGWWISPLPFIVNEADEQVLYNYSDPFATCGEWGVAGYLRIMRLKGPLFGASKILAASDKFAEMCRGCGVPKVIVMANGISDIQRRGRTISPDGRVRLGFLGSMEHATGFEIIKYALLSRKFERLRLIAVDARLVPGSVRQEMWNTTAIEFVSEIPDNQLAEFYADIDVLLAPSVWPESFGLAAREALHCGCWVVASNRGSVGDCVTHGENGYVIDVADAMALIGVLALIDGNPERYLEAPSARPVARRSSEQGDELAGLYKSIIASRSTSAAVACYADPNMTGTSVRGQADLC